MNDSIDIIRAQMDGLKLYHITVEIEGFVLAKSEQAARSELYDLVSDAYYRDSAYIDEVRHGDSVKSDWDDDCFCYGTPCGVDIDLGSARKIIAERAKP